MKNRKNWAWAAILVLTVVFFVSGRFVLAPDTHVEIEELIGTWRDGDTELRLWLETGDGVAHDLHAETDGLFGPWQGQMQALHLPHEIGGHHEVLQTVGGPWFLAVQPANATLRVLATQDRAEVLVEKPFTHPETRVLFPVK